MTSPAKKGEVVSIEAIVRGRGLGRALMDGIRDRARQAGCHELWLVTTNDNIPAMSVPAEGIDLIAIGRDAVTEASHARADHSRYRIFRDPETTRIGAGSAPMT